MGYLDNTTTTVDAILTKKGRELLARGENEFKITKFSLSDDEIDYTLWDVTHPDGTNSYGAAIENMPLLEAFPDENQVMRYKLVTLPKDTAKLPIIEVPQSSILFKNAGVVQPITPTTRNGSDAKLGYSIILHNSDAADLVVSFKEKPQTARGWINGGYFVIEPEFFDLIQGDSSILEKEPLEKVAEMGELMAYKHEGFWQCMDTKRDKDSLDELWRTNRAPWKKQTT